MLDQNGETPFTVHIDRRVEKDLDGLPHHIVQRFLNILDEFEWDPITPRSGFDVKPLKGLPGTTYRLRIGRYRVLYEVDDHAHIVRITSILHRSRAY